MATIRRTIRSCRRHATAFSEIAKEMGHAPAQNVSDVFEHTAQHLEYLADFVVGLAHEIEHAAADDSIVVVSNTVIALPEWVGVLGQVFNDEEIPPRTRRLSRVAFVEMVKLTDRVNRLLKLTEKMEEKGDENRAREGD